MHYAAFLNDVRSTSYIYIVFQKIKNTQILSICITATKQEPIKNPVKSLRLTLYYIKRNIKSSFVGYLKSRNMTSDGLKHHTNFRYFKYSCYENNFYIVLSDLNSEIYDYHRFISKSLN